MHNTLLNDIEAFLAETGLSEAKFGRAINNSHLLERLRDGVTPKKGKPVRIWPDSEVRIRAFMMSERQKRAVAA